MFDRLQQRYALTILKPLDILCAGGRCIFERGGAPLYVDGEHLAIGGAPLCIAAVDPVFAENR
jgi:SGNH domain (fused to AT3 domains)